VLRALRRFDWAAALEIRVALGGDESPAIGASLGKLRAAGLVERRRVVEKRDPRGRPLCVSEYRITAAGRAHLDEALDPGGALRRGRP